MQSHLFPFASGILTHRKHLAVFVCWTLAMLGSANAVDLTWDADTDFANGITVDGGTWKEESLTNPDGTLKLGNWRNTTANQPWAVNSVDTAIFAGGTDGTAGQYKITVSGNPTYSGIKINNSGYFFTKGTTAEGVTISGDMTIADGKIFGIQNLQGLGDIDAGKGGIFTINQVNSWTYSGLFKGGVENTQTTGNVIRDLGSTTSSIDKEGPGHILLYGERHTFAGTLNATAGSVRSNGGLSNYLFEAKQQYIEVAGTDLNNDGDFVDKETVGVDLNGDGDMLDKETEPITKFDRNYFTITHSGLNAVRLSGSATLEFDATGQTTTGTEDPNN